MIVPTFGPITSAEFDNTVESKICLKCQAHAPRKKNMIKCMSCGLWAHLSCVGLSKRQADSLAGPWSCDPCISHRLGLDSHFPEPPDPGNSGVPPDLAEALAKLKKRTTLVKRIPKGVRLLVADSLASAINRALSDPSPRSWYSLLCFAFKYLRYCSNNQTASANIRAQLRDDFLSASDSTTHESPSSISSDPEKVAKRAMSKLADGDIRAALRTLTSDDTFCAPSAETVELLMAKHPPAPADFVPPVLEADHPVAPVYDEDQVADAYRTMSAGSSGGLDAMRPIYIQQCISPETAEAGRRLLTALTKLANAISRGDIPEYAIPAVFGASLCAVGKREGGVRPIAVGSVYRRAAGKLGVRQSSSRLAAELAPVQLGVGVSGGCEAAVHATREYAAIISSNPASDQVLVKIDMKNAFNTVRRDTVLKEIARRCPELSYMAGQAYNRPTPLFCGDSRIWSSAGVQQGDPLGPLGFALAVDPCARAIRSPFNIWYLDDCTVAGPADTVRADLESLVLVLRDIGLELNEAKCEVSYLGPPDTMRGADSLAVVQSVLPSVNLVPLAELTMLRSPLFPGGLDKSLGEARKVISSLTRRL